MKLKIPTQPVPASRPRVTRWGTYYSKTYKAWMKAADALLNHAGGPLDGPLAVTVESVFERARTSKLTHPSPDVDNLAKAVLDALTKKGYWNDDRQVVELLTTKRFALKGECPGSYITIRKL